MPSRSVRRRQHQQYKRLGALPPRQRDARAVQRLAEWREEAYRRANVLGEAAVWALANDPRVRAIAAALDPSGALQAELDRVCAEAVAGAAGVQVRPSPLPPEPPPERVWSPDCRPIVVRERRCS